MKLRRLKILEFRNVQPGTELEFNDGYNVLLGQNGSGKTTLLRLITSVLRGDFRWLEKETFALEAALDRGVSKLALAITHKRRERKERQLGAVPSELRALVPTNGTWSTTMDLRLITGEGETLELHRDQNGASVVGPGLARSQSTAGRLTDLHNIHGSNAAVMFLDTNFDLTVSIISMLAPNDVFRFDESLEVFSSITGRGSALGKTEYGDVSGRISTSSTKIAFGNLVSGTLVPAEIKGLEQLKTPNFDSPADTIILKHDQAPFLDKVVQMLGYVGAEIKLDLLGKDVSEEQQKIEYGNLRFFFHGRDGSIVNQDHLSYGKKRLLTFFYYLACNPHVVVADELVNGLHHAWIAECIREMGDRQVFVTSQNPILLDHLGFDSADQVRRTFITCQAKPEGVRDRITWANMSKKNAESFYRAYKVGAQHVGEILRTKGFW